MSFRGTIIIKREEEWFVATCLENNIASQGKTIDEAILNLKEAIALYYEDEAEEELNLTHLTQKQVFPYFSKFPQRRS
jgi:predicted RNase H-like HicB family nuclease